MTRYLQGSGAFLVVCLAIPGTGLAQNELPTPLPGTAIPQPVTDPSGTPLIRRPDWETPGGGYRPYPGSAYGPRVGVGPAWGMGPGWGYPGFGGGGFISPGFGWPVYSGRSGSTWSNGLSLYGPPVPTIGPVPGVFGNNDLVQQWRAVPSPGFANVGVGIYAGFPRPRYLTTGVGPNVDRLIVGAPSANPTSPGGCLILSVKVPQPTAELYVNGVKTPQTGMDRLFNSPVLEAGKEFRYEVTARWIERGVTYEKKKLVSGTPGEVVRVDFTAPDVVIVER